MKIGFEKRFGYNELEIPITDETTPKFRPYGMADKFARKVTIYNDIPADSVNPRRFDRFVIDKCLIYDQLTESADGTIQKIINAQNVVTKDVEHYKTPLEYLQLAEDERESFYTVRVDDFVVLAEVDDVVNDWEEFDSLQKKYKANGFSVTSVNASIFGMNVDNIHIMHA